MDLNKMGLKVTELKSEVSAEAATESQPNSEASEAAAAPSEPTTSETSDKVEIDFHDGLDALKEELYLIDDSPQTWLEPHNWVTSLLKMLCHR